MSGSRSAIESPTPQRHALWVRVCHWVLAVSVVTLAYSGFYILMAHPRLYWGEVGNDLTPAWLELPLNDNHRPSGWQQTVTFEALANKPISANRTIEIFNENGWARSLHFLAGWFFVVTGAFYVALGVITKHVSRDLWPRGLRQAGAGPYGLLQRCAYTSVAFLCCRSWLSPAWRCRRGSSPHSRRCSTCSVVISPRARCTSSDSWCFSLFVVVHLAMVVLTGFGRQMRAMIVGR